MSRERGSRNAVKWFVRRGGGIPSPLEKGDKLEGAEPLLVVASGPGCVSQADYAAAM